ncbi:hypothetical protein AX17_004240 [Amanita inopinata Kibby_2008]|nr:hypothetical protein AX17_004240 [Amanita inopinata Kibby_2008]
MDIVMVLKKVPHYRVNVSPALPRPEVTDLLGITYRRMPLLAIGNDVYCDTSLIVPVLERRFPAAAGYGTLFPKNKHTGHDDSVLVRLFAQYYAETSFVPLSIGVRPWETFPAAVVKDRSLLLGRTVDPQWFIARRPVFRSRFASHLALIEEQLQDGREWLFHTGRPSLADVSIYFFFNWIKKYPAAQGLVDPLQFPRTAKWLERLSQHIESKRQEQRSPTVVTGDQAANMITSSSPEPLDVVGFDTAEAGQLGLKQGDTVQIAPIDYGTKYPTSGELVAFSKLEMVIRVKGSRGTLHCHFPRLGYSVKPAAASAKL